MPCHRVVASTGALTGYGGGLERKRWLLAHEAGRRMSRLFQAGSALGVRHVGGPGGT